MAPCAQVPSLERTVFERPPRARPPLDPSRDHLRDLSSRLSGWTHGPHRARQDDNIAFYRTLDTQRSEPSGVVRSDHKVCALCLDRMPARSEITNIRS